MVTLVNYGLGNIQAFHHIYTRLNLPVVIASTPEELSQADRLILPGVGAFDWAMTRLNQSGMRETLDDLVLNHQIPVLGICVGMQMMAHRSDEGVMTGLGWGPGQVKRLAVQPEATDLRRELALPHMGWNDVTPTKDDPVFRDLADPRFYFLHSYYFVPDQVPHSLATTHYGEEFTAAVCNGHIYGVQFHPEKSHGWGIQLLKNFAEL
jgi:glutamine amidotransferase